MSKVKIIATRVTKPFADLVESFVEKDSHLNVAEFARDAMREKIKREAPDLYASMFKEEKHG